MHSTYSWSLKCTFWQDSPAKIDHPTGCGDLADGENSSLWPSRVPPFSCPQSAPQPLSTAWPTSKLKSVLVMILKVPNPPLLRSMISLLIAEHMASGVASSCHDSAYPGVPWCCSRPAWRSWIAIRQDFAAIEIPNRRDGSECGNMYNWNASRWHGPKSALSLLISTRSYFLLVGDRGVPEPAQFWMHLFFSISMILSLSGMTTGLLLTQVLGSEWHVSNHQSSTPLRLLTIHCEFSIVTVNCPMLKFF